MKKKIAVVVILFLFVLFLGYKYMYHNHRNISTEKAAFAVTPVTIISEFEKDESVANKKYLDKLVLVKGKVTSIDLANKTIVLDNKIFALMASSISFKVNSEIVIKGRLIGYDSLLGEIKLDQTELN